MAVVLFAVLLRTNRITSVEIIYFCVLIPSIILHEISHGVVALAFGDDTAKRAGRLTLNPTKHVDPVGTLLVPAVLSLSGIGAYGWAKPVPVSTNRLRTRATRRSWSRWSGRSPTSPSPPCWASVYVLVTPRR